MFNKKEKIEYYEIPERMLELADKVTTMGRVVYALSYYDNEKLVLNEEDGQNLGSIIRDYGIELKKNIDKTYGALCDFYKEYDGSLSYELGLHCKGLQKTHGYNNRDLKEINESLDEIKRFEAEAVKVEEFKKSLLQVKQCIEKQVTGKEPFFIPRKQVAKPDIKQEVELNL
jgi:hypothetical protein